MKWRAVLLALALGSACGEGRSAAQTGISSGSDTSFAGLITAISEPGGYFDTDNLISNESSYLHALDALDALGVSGGAYLGVGPGQNFAYIAKIQPAIAFIVDIRRDNLLEHLLFKALFARSRDRVTYLAGLFGVRPPIDSVRWSEQPASALVDYIDGATRDPTYAATVVEDVQERVQTFGLELSSADLQTIERFHRAFISDGMDLRFHSFGRPPQWYYPTFRDLLLETDRAGRQRSMFATESAFQSVRTLSVTDRIVPVVGNLAGDHALRTIATYLRERDLAVSAFYTSNVEFYLYGDGTFDRFAANVVNLPLASSAVIIRSVFRGRHPLSLPGYGSTQVVQSLPAFVRVVRTGSFRGYWDLVTRDMVEVEVAPRPRAARLPERFDDRDDENRHRDQERGLYEQGLDLIHQGASRVSGAGSIPIIGAPALAFDRR